MAVGHRDDGLRYSRPHVERHAIERKVEVTFDWRVRLGFDSQELKPDKRGEPAEGSLTRIQHLSQTKLCKPNEKLCSRAIAPNPYLNPISQTID